MNYYKHYVGDFQRKTRHLSLMEQGVYRAMLDHYYATEKPLPRDPASLCRLVGCQTKAEREAVGKIAAEFFREEDGGLINGRAKEEIEAYATLCDTNHRIAVEREAKRKAHASDTVRSTDRATERITLDAPSHSQKPEAREVREILDEVNGSLRAKRRGPNYSDPSVRKARWEQKIMTEINSTMPPPDAQSLIAAYMASEPWAVAQFNAISDQLRAMKEKLARSA